MQIFDFRNQVFKNVCKCKQCLNEFRKNIRDIEMTNYKIREKNILFFRIRYFLLTFYKKIFKKIKCFIELIKRKQYVIKSKKR